jgi:hypothetical protein
LTAKAYFSGHHALAPKKLAIWVASPYMKRAIGIGSAADGWETGHAPATNRETAVR